MIRYIIISLLAWIVYTDVSGQSKFPSTYRIEIQNRSMLQDTKWFMSKDSLRLEQRNINGTVEVHIKPLTEANNDAIIRSLIKINFNNIPKDTVDHFAPDDMGEYDFRLTIDKMIKEFHIYQVKIDDVFRLVKQINEFLPRKYQIGYNDDYFRFKNDN